MNLAPICLFTYNRKDETKKTIDALKNNFLAKESDLFIFSDGWKDNDSKIKVDAVRDYLKQITGFKSVSICESSVNKGLANSIISGVSKVVDKYGRVIVLEDDLITSPNFLNFMNQALNFYEENLEVFSISGYSMDLKSLKDQDTDYYLGYRASSWGWGTWRRSWEDIDWEIKNYKTFSRSYKLNRQFNKGGSDMSRMLRNQMNKKIDSWAIRWCYNQYIRNQLTIYPVISKVKSIGFGEDATHTKYTNRFNTIIDTELKEGFLFDNKLVINNKLIKEFKSKFSILSRLNDRFL